MLNYYDVKNDVIQYGFGGTLFKSALTQEAQKVYMPVIAKKRSERISRNEQRRKKEKEDDYVDSLYYASAFLQKQDGIERDVYEISGNPYIVKIGSKSDLYDSDFNKYGKSLKNHDLIRKDFLKLVVYIKLNNSYARIFKASRLNEEEILLDLSEPKAENTEREIPDYVILK